MGEKMGVQLTKHMETILPLTKKLSVNDNPLAKGESVFFWWSLAEYNNHPQGRPHAQE